MSSLKLSRHWLSYGLASLLVLMLFFLTFGEWGLIHYLRLSEERTRLEQRTRAVQRANELLREKIYRLGNDAQYLEKVAREELGLAKDGEIVYRFPSARLSNTGDSVTTPSESRRSSGRNALP